MYKKRSTLLFIKSNFILITIKFNRLIVCLRIHNGIKIIITSIYTIKNVNIKFNEKIINVEYDR